MSKPYIPSVPPMPVEIPSYAFPHRCDIWPARQYYDDAGGRLPSFSVASYRNVSCVITIASAEEIDYFNRLGEVVSHMIGFGKDVLLQSDDRVTFVGLTSKQPRLLDVRYYKNHDEMNVLWTAATREIFREKENV